MSQFRKMKWIVLVAPFLFVFVILTVPAALLAVLAGGDFSEQQAASQCQPQTSGDTEEVSFGYDNLDAEQKANISMMLGVIKARNLTPKEFELVALTSITKAWAESKIHNLDYSLGDAIGLFQQKPQWGSYADRHDPRKAYLMFLDGGKVLPGNIGGRPDTAEPGLFAIPNWRGLDPITLGDKVQPPQYPGAASTFLSRARAIVASIHPSTSDIPSSGQLVDFTYTKNLDAEQRQIISLILSKANDRIKVRKLTPVQAQLVRETALITAAAETVFRNLGGDPKGVIGVYQQKEEYFGPYADRHNPSKAIDMFFDGVTVRTPLSPNLYHTPGLFDIKGWDTMNPGTLSEAIQRSGRPDRPPTFLPLARAIINSMVTDTKAATVVDQPISIKCVPKGSTPQIEQVIAYALSKVGAPFRDGFVGPDDFDSGGFTLWAFKQLKVDLPHYVFQQFDQGSKVSLPDYNGKNQEEIAALLKRGDLVYWNDDPGGPQSASSTGIYLGQNQFVGVDKPAGSVKVQAMKWDGFVGATRPIAVVDLPKGPTGPVLQNPGAWTMPLDTINISSRCAMRFHPYLHVWKYHNGDDFAAPGGTPIYAAARGYVEFAGWSTTGWGYRVILVHNMPGHRLVTTYNHMNASPVVAIGTVAEPHQLIGHVGTTGYSTGNHLHFSVILDGYAIDPMVWLMTQRVERCPGQLGPRLPNG